MRRRSLYAQLESGLGKPLAEAYQDADNHLFWRGGRTPTLTFHGKTYRVARLLKHHVKDSHNEVVFSRTPFRFYRLCDEPLCCNPHHMGTYREALAKRSSSDTMELVNELLPLEENGARYDNLGDLMQAVNPFYSEQDYISALTTGLLPRLRQQLLRPNTEGPPPPED